MKAAFLTHFYSLTITHSLLLTHSHASAECRSLSELNLGKEEQERHRVDPIDSVIKYVGSRDPTNPTPLRCRCVMRW